VDEEGKEVLEDIGEAEGEDMIRTIEDSQIIILGIEGEQMEVTLIITNKMLKRYLKKTMNSFIDLIISFLFINTNKNS